MQETVMVDMVEARKRARRTSQATAEPLTAPEPFKPAKPVLRSEPSSLDEGAPGAPPTDVVQTRRSRTRPTGAPPVPDSSAYYPVEQPLGPEDPPPSPEIFTQVPVPTESMPEDQVDFMQKLMMEDEEEEAERLAESATVEEELELLVFQLGQEHYGISIHQIAEIIRFVEPTDVPNTIAFLDGIISLRGKMIPVINGRRRLGHNPVETDKRTRIVVLSENLDYVGILVDSASQVVRLPVRAIEPTPNVVVGIDAEFIQGVCEHRSNLIILLNLERFLQFH